MPRMRSGAIVAVAAIAVLAAACSTGGSGGSAAKTATNAAGVGGMDALVTAAKAEGKLNVIALPPEWANYKGVIAAFKAKYDLTVDEQQPDANSQEEIDAAKNNAGTDKAPDVFDLGVNVALANLAVFAPYQVASWADIPANLKESTGLWVSDYAGFMSIGCDAKQGPRAGDRRGHAEARVQGQDRPQRQPQGRVGRDARRGHGRTGQRRVGRRHRAGRRVLQSAERGRQPAPGRSRPRPRSRRARRRASSTGNTTTLPSPRSCRVRASTGSCRSPPTPRRSRRTTCRRSTRMRRILRPPACGRSSCTPRKPRTSG